MKIDLNMPDLGPAGYSSGVLDALEPMTFPNDMTYLERMCRILMMQHMANAIDEVGWFEHTSDFDPYWTIQWLDDNGNEKAIATYDTIAIENFDSDTIFFVGPQPSILLVQDDDETPVRIPIDKITYLGYIRC